MSGICSAHIGYRRGCVQCEAPHYDEENDCPCDDHAAMRKAEAVRAWDETMRLPVLPFPPDKAIGRKRPE